MRILNLESHRGYLRRTITVTLSLIKFNTWILAQIVENRETRLYKRILGPGDIFSESYDMHYPGIHSTRTIQPQGIGVYPGTVEFLFFITFFWFKLLL
jgi:hypothetical protein